MDSRRHHWAQVMPLVGIVSKSGFLGYAAGGAKKLNAERLSGGGGSADDKSVN